ncbi:uncharacterized protein LOC111630616 isoform X1 [Centruroides sculpturatus]|uniref:uncharacterized protein LOC111630616 isoform X1 n=1 Tax=Centruroides sculpturatus TaxID=218467 RepID=UPI000C6CFC4A|nr:uncharacterized protein LOC111630616 isoform X1 [Centruroides sculpturatus]
MCLFVPSLTDIFRYVPYLWLACLPLCGTIWGIRQAAGQSILMLVFVVVSSLIPGNWKTWISFLDFLIFLCLLSFPYTIVPSILIWIYYYSMIAVEPLLLAIESYQAVYFITAIGQELANLVEERPFHGKGLTLVVSGLAYFLTISVAVSPFVSSFPVWVRWTLAVCSLVSICVTIHNDYGIISDCASVSLLSWLVLCDGPGETYAGSRFTDEQFKEYVFLYFTWPKKRFA